jgi:protein-disulfide isomerase-like protein with CxxC motif
MRTGFPMYNDPDDWYERLGISSFPTKLFIRDGIVLRVRRGASAETYEVLKALIESEIAKPE